MLVKGINNLAEVAQGKGRPFPASYTVVLVKMFRLGLEQSGWVVWVTMKGMGWVNVMGEGRESPLASSLTLP